MGRWMVLLGLVAGCTLLSAPGDYEDGEAADGGRRPDAQASCGTDAECGTGVCVGGECVACRESGDCAATEPVCVDGTCGPCSRSVQCSGRSDGPVCAAGSCVECAGSADCADPELARCDSNRCVPCVDRSDCAGTGDGICVSGRCVECTVDDESACGDNSCDPATNTCTGTLRASVGRCGACRADSECGLPDDACVPTFFQGAAREGGYCLKLGSTGCMRPYTVPTAERASLSGVEPAVYCGIQEDLTTCEAVLDLVNDSSCGAAPECGAPGLDDAVCQTVNLVANKCSYRCGVDANCTNSRACGASGMYCGAPAL